MHLLHTADLVVLDNLDNLGVIKERKAGIIERNVTVFTDTDKGDVDGDGVVTNKDALILLQGINDLYNLSAEEFARADINENGVLETTGTDYLKEETC